MAAGASARGKGGRANAVGDARAASVAGQTERARGEKADPRATGAQPTLEADGSLPFTGLQLALLGAVGLLGLAGGLVLRRRVLATRSA
ncbi:MAG: hypothetical protein ACRDL0_16520 [Thermoleophilaceae bacterium]